MHEKRAQILVLMYLCVSTKLDNLDSLSKMHELIQIRFNNVLSDYPIYCTPQSSINYVVNKISFKSELITIFLLQYDDAHALFFSSQVFMFNYFISHTYMYARNHCFSLFRMKTVADLRMLMNGYKKDVSEDGSLLAPDVTNGLVLYINSNLKNAKPVEIARIVKM